MMQSSVWKECLQGLMGNGLENSTPVYRKAFDDICSAMTDQVAFAGIVGKVKEMDGKIGSVEKVISAAGVQANKALNHVRDAGRQVDSKIMKVNLEMKKVEQLLQLKNDIQMDDRAMVASMLFDNILTRGQQLSRYDSEQLIRTAGNICSAYLMGGNAVIIKNEDLDTAIEGLKAVSDKKGKVGKRF